MDPLGWDCEVEGFTNCRCIDADYFVGVQLGEYVDKEIFKVFDIYDCRGCPSVAAIRSRQETAQ